MEKWEEVGTIMTGTVNPTCIDVRKIPSMQYTAAMAKIILIDIN